MKIPALIPLALMASVAAPAAVQADETSTPLRNPTEASQPITEGRSRMKTAAVDGSSAALSFRCTKDHLGEAFTSS